MNILWSVNTLMPDVAKMVGTKSSHAISWVDAMSKELIKDKNVNLAIAAVGNVHEVKYYSIGGILYYVLPTNVSESDWVNVISTFKPDIIHAYGTEKTHNMPLIGSSKIKVPIVISLQGILTQYERFYYGGIDVGTLIKNITIRDIIRGTVFQERERFIKQSKNERWMLQHVKYVEGRSTWDKVSSLGINPNLDYYHCPRLIREPFYNIHWSHDNMERHSIFVHQGNYPIKGLHFVFEAMETILKKYPDAKLYIAGNDVLHKSNWKQKILRNGYSKYLKSLFSKYHLENHVIFTGTMSATEVAKFLSKMNVLVIPSVIENCPNSLAEGMLVGVPSVVSYVGGNAELLNNGECGELYCYNEPLMLAHCVDRIFSSKELAINYSKKASAVASQRHDPNVLKQQLLSIYNKIIEKEK